MKIRNRQLIAAAGWLGTRAARLLFRTLRFDYHPLGPSFVPAHLPPGERIIYCIWHENLLLPTVYFGSPEIAVLISRHADGQILGGLITALGMGMVQGSTNRGGVEAVRRLIGEQHRWRHLAVTPDGPRGPRRVVQPGIVYVASRTGMKIAPIGVGYCRPWRAKSWDRFAVPRPFSRARGVTADLIAVPNGLRAVDLEPFRLRVQAEMDRVNALAEAWAETGRLTLPPDDVARPFQLAS
jgi:lysophospholipid acyltransferase (LPLAT)-like uncharacterized protein